MYQGMAFHILDPMAITLQKAIVDEAKRGVYPFFQKDYPIVKDWLANGYGNREDLLDTNLEYLLDLSDRKKMLSKTFKPVREANRGVTLGF
jgi:hypothetical protein